MSVPHPRCAMPGLACALAIAAGLLPVPASATEGGASFYLLGSGGPGAAEMPPLEGIYFDDVFYYYNGDVEAGRNLVLNRRVVVGLEAEIIANFPTVLAVPSTDFLGGTVALGLTVPIGHPDIDVQAVLTGPSGGQLSASRHDAATVIGDPVVTGMIGWKAGEHLHVQASTQVNVPIGNYREDQLANLAFNRWVVDVSGAVTWKDPEASWDVSGKMGISFNGRNDFTDYDTGNEFHAEASVQRIFSPQFSAGLQFYHFDQLSGDSGSGALLGPNKGRVSAAGVTAAYNFMVDKTPATARVRAFKEFDARRRLEGTSVFFSLTFPLWMNLPPTPPS